MNRHIVTLPFLLFIGTNLLACDIRPIPTAIFATLTSVPVASQTPTTVPLEVLLAALPPTPVSPRCWEYGFCVKVWEDINENGLQESNERNLPDVCILKQYSWLKDEYTPTELKTMCDSRRVSRTDSRGLWCTMYSSCDLGQYCGDYTVMVIPQDGYELTTPNLITGCNNPKFGLKPVPTATPRAISP